MTMDPSDLAALQQVAKDEGLSSVSAALRFVLRRYVRQQEQAAEAVREYEAGATFALGAKAFRVAFGGEGVGSKE